MRPDPVVRYHRTMKQGASNALIERRFVPLDRLRGLEVRAVSGGASVLSGHAALFESDSEEMYGFIERVARGAFAGTIKANDIRGLFNHDPNYILGRNVAKTMRLVEDDLGLAFEIDLPDTQVARDLKTSITRGDVTGCSFSFSTLSDEWNYESDPMRRTLKEVRLYDVGPVTFPAYPATDVSARDREAYERIANEARDRKAALATPPTPPSTVTAVTLGVRARELDLIDL